MNGPVEKGNSDLVQLQADGTTKTVHRKSYDADGNVLTVWEPDQYGIPSFTHLSIFTVRPRQTNTGFVNCLNCRYDPVIAGADR